MVETQERLEGSSSRRCEDAGADGLELNFGCPHGMCERGMGSAVGQEPKLLQEITSWAKEFATTPGARQAHAEHRRHPRARPRRASRAAPTASRSSTRSRASSASTSTASCPCRASASASTNGGYCGPAVKPIALHMVAALARDPGIKRPDLAASAASRPGATRPSSSRSARRSVQVCTAVMHYGYRIVEDMIEGLSEYLDSHGMKSVERAPRPRRPGLPGVGRSRPQLQARREDRSEDLHRLPALRDRLPRRRAPVHLHRSGRQARARRTRTRSARRRRRARFRSGRSPVTACRGSTSRSASAATSASSCVPVPGCITMVEERKGPPETWNDRVTAGRDKLPGGIHDPESGH